MTIIELTGDNSQLSTAVFIHLFVCLYCGYQLLNWKCYDKLTMKTMYVTVQRSYHLRALLKMMMMTEDQVFSVREHVDLRLMINC